MQSHGFIGKAYINGVVHNLSDEFGKEVLFLSDQLNIDEFVAATLLVAALGESTRSCSNNIDTAVTLYHTERGFLLAALDVMLQTAKDKSVSEPIRHVLHRFLGELLEEHVSMGSEGNTQVSFMEKIVQTTEDLRKMIESIKKTGTVDGFPMNSNGVQSGRLGDDVTKLRIERFTDERVYLAQIIYHICSLFWIGEKDVLGLVSILESSDLLDVTTPYILVSLLAAISFSYHYDEAGKGKFKMTYDQSFLDHFHTRIVSNLWTVPALKSVVIIQWVLFQNQVGYFNPQRLDSLPASDDELDELTEGAVSAEVFRFISEYLLYFQQPNVDVDIERGIIKNSVFEGREFSIDGVKVDRSDFSKFNATIREEFRPFVIREMENLTSKFIERMSGFLRRLRYREEDSNFHTDLQVIARGNTSAKTEASHQRLRRDLQAFFTVLSSVYRNRVNAGIRFWTRGEGSLVGFMKWMTDLRLPGTVQAALEFVASVSTGDECAQHAYLFLESNSNRTDMSSSALFSWGKLFGAMQFYTAHLRDNTHNNMPRVIPEVEEGLLKRFLTVLKQVAQFSSEARMTLWSDHVYNARNSLVGLLSCRTSTDVRAVLFDTLAAFCSPWGGGSHNVGRTIALQVWELLEHSGFLLPKIYGEEELKHIPEEDHHLLRWQAGFLRELEIERSRKIYDETLAVLHLMASAIHVQSKRESLVSGFVPMPSTLPSMLGKETRSPGGAPYISLVTDDVFLSLNEQRYYYQGTKWQLADACLKILEHSVESFDLRPLEQLVSSLPERDKANTYKTNASTSGRSSTASLESLERLLLVYVTHPGFEVIIRILSGSTLLTEMLNTVELGVNATESNHKTQHFNQAIQRCLRIILRILEIQPLFYNMLMPYVKHIANLNSSTELKVGGFTFAPLPTLAPLGQLMMYQANSVAQIAKMMNSGNAEEIALLSTRIIRLLALPSDHQHVPEIVARHTNFYPVCGGLGVQLVKFLGARIDALSIIRHLSEILDIEQPEIITYDDYEYDINNIPFWRATHVLEDRQCLKSGFTPYLERSSRLAIVDLLLENSRSGSSSPSVADFFLGYNVTGSLNDSFEDTRHGMMACLESILRLTSAGHDVQDASMNPTEVNAQQPPLITTHPLLAEKCYRLIYQLCSNETLCESTLRYLRNSQDFFFKHFKGMPSRLECYVPAGPYILPGTIECVNGSKFPIDFFALRSQLHQRAWLLKMVALEIHVTKTMNLKGQATRFLDLIYGRRMMQRRRRSDTMDEDDNAKLKRQKKRPWLVPGQELDQPLIKVLEILSTLDFTWTDDMMDIPKMDLFFYKDFDSKAYEIVNEYGCKVYDIQSIYEILRGEQRRLESDPSLLYNSDRHKPEDEMGYVLQTLVTENHSREIAHARLHCLQAWKQLVHVTLVECFDLFPETKSEPLIRDLLSMILKRMRDTSLMNSDLFKGLSEVVLILMSRLKESAMRTTNNKWTYIHLPDEIMVDIFTGIVTGIEEAGTMVARGNLYMTLVSFLQLVSPRQATTPSSQEDNAQPLRYSPEFVSNLVNVVGSHERVLSILSKDAVDGIDVWKTTAYAAIDALYALANRAGSPLVTTFLSKSNFLRCTHTEKEFVALLSNKLNKP